MISAFRLNAQVVTKPGAGSKMQCPGTSWTVFPEEGHEALVAVYAIVGHCSVLSPKAQLANDIEPVDPSMKSKTVLTWQQTNSHTPPGHYHGGWKRRAYPWVRNSSTNKINNSERCISCTYLYKHTGGPTQQKSNPVLVPHIPTPLQVLAFEIQWDTVLGSAPMATSTQGNPWQAWPWQVWQQYQMQQQQRRRQQQHMVPMSSSSDTPRKAPTANLGQRAHARVLYLFNLSEANLIQSNLHNLI